MENPWEIDQDDIPADRAVRARIRRLRMVGILLWGLIIGSTVVLFVSDTGDLAGHEILLLAIVAVLIAVLAIGSGILSLSLIETGGYPAKIALGILLTLGLFASLPIVVSFVFEHVPLFDDIVTGSGNPVARLLEMLTG